MNSREPDATLPNVVVVVLPDVTVVKLPRLLNVSAPLPNSQVVFPLVAIRPAEPSEVEFPVIVSVPLFSVSAPAVNVVVPDVCHDRVPELLTVELAAAFRFIRPRIVPALLIVIGPAAAPATNTTRSEVKLPVDWITPPTLLFNVRLPVEYITTDGLLPPVLLTVALLLTVTAPEAPAA